MARARVDGKAAILHQSGAPCIKVFLCSTVIGCELDLPPDVLGGALIQQLGVRSISNLWCVYLDCAVSIDTNSKVFFYICKISPIYWRCVRNSFNDR